MFKVKVLKLKDIIKYLVVIAIIIVAIITTRYFSSYKVNKLSQIPIGLTRFLDTEIVAIKEVNEEYNKIENENKENEKESTNYLQKILQTQIVAMKAIDKEDINSEDVNDEEQKEVVAENQENSKPIQVAETEKVTTEVVTQNAIAESYNVQYNVVKIKNQTDYTLTQEIMTPDIKIDNKSIVIFHTHSCESYTPSEKYQYTQTGNFRTTDLNFTVTRVGSELENYLKLYNYNVVHDTSYHDYPSYTGSYTRSLSTVENILKTTSSDIIIDLHRDAVGSRSDYAPTVKIGDEYAAQIMFVIGTNRRRVMASKLESKFKICNKNSRKGRRNVSRVI